MKKLVVLSGAGMSAESGLRTFREMGGLWEEYDVYEVASPGGWQKDRELVLRFYNERRKQLLEAEPNAGHLGLVELEKFFEVWIVTQNIDDLHERAGSSRILHLHGEIRKARSTADPSLVYDIEGWKLEEGDLCEKGSQLRPHVVWFGETLPEAPLAAALDLSENCDLFLVIGTSSMVQPAASLPRYALRSKIFTIEVNPEPTQISEIANEYIQSNSGIALPKLLEEMKKYL